jgi:hypothetical protein
MTLAFAFVSPARQVSAAAKKRPANQHTRIGMVGGNASGS